MVHSKAGALAAFTTKKAKCVGCKAVLRREGSAVCDSCKGKASDIYQKEISQLYNLEEKFLLQRTNLYKPEMRNVGSAKKILNETYQYFNMLFLLLYFYSL